MATLADASPSPPRSMRTKRKSFARRCERCCWSFFTYFPLAMVYGLTSWAVWVQASVSLGPKKYGFTGTTTALLGIILYLLLNWSYTVAVFTDPGSPLTQTTSAYSIVPTTDDDEDDIETNTSRPLTDHGPAHASVTVKSTGEMRYCKKCHTRKPDRAHHCSTCRRCVLKMDHHCPWLATCVGFRNQKPFILFLVYVSLFCWVCFATTATWVAAEIWGELQNNENLFPVNCILLAVLSSIIGLVITGFTAWHIWLATRAQTTIESLEATRYVVPLRKSLRQQPFGSGHTPEQRNYTDSMNKPATPEPTFGSQLRSIHANVLPGITRPEEGVETPDRSVTPSDLSSSPAHGSLRQHLNPGAYHRNREIEHERARYEAYQDEVDSSKLPHAFNHGWRRNLTQLFGDRLELAWLPICNSKGDGWNWEPSKEWLEARDQLEREREARKREEAAFRQDRAETMPSFRKEAVSSSSDDDDVPLARRLGRGPPAPPPRGSSRPLIEQARLTPRTAITGPTSNWNDLPDDFLAPSRRDGAISRSKSPGLAKNGKTG